MQLFEFKYRNKTTYIRMRLVERHIVKKQDEQWKAIDHTCFLSKNLYNAALYRIRQEYKATGKWLRYNTLEKLLRREENSDYRSLPNNSSQQTLMLVDKAYKSFFALLRSAKKSKSLYFPKPPQYKHKTNGRNIVVFTYTQVRVNKKDGLIHFPKKTGISHLKTKVLSDQFQQVRIIPQASCYVIEVVYEKPEQNLNLDKKRIIAIDLGVNNLAAITSNQPGLKPLLINGKPLKSMNQFFNKEKARLQSLLNQNQNQHSSNRIRALTLKRQCKINNYLHHASKAIVQYCVQNNIGKIVIGKNIGWKQEVNIGRRNNQNFVQIPFNTFIQQLQYKALMIGIEVSLREESYTSKCSAFDLESIEKHEVYLGRRIKRGLFKTASGVKLNADINGSLNILRKEIGDEFLKKNLTLNRGYVHYPSLITSV